MKHLLIYPLFAILIFSCVSIAATTSPEVTVAVGENENEWNEDVSEINEEYQENCSDCVGGEENVNEYNEENTEFAEDLTEDASEHSVSGKYTASTMITLFQQHGLPTPCPGVANACPPSN